MKNLPAVSFKDVSFGFNGKAVLRKFSFDAGAGRHTILKGESGSGKSTALKILLGFHRPSSGTILFDNTRQWTAQTIRKQTAWLPQDLDLGDGNVREIMAKPFKFTLNKFTGDREEPLVETLDKLGLPSSILSEQFRDLSTGQRQRIGLAICFLLDKPLLLLDEPTSSLDRASKKKAAELLFSKKKTIISTSHDAFWVDFGDNIVNLS